MGEAIKKFLEWAGVKSVIHETEKFIRCKERDVWWIHLGLNIGDEVDGKHAYFDRPAIIVKKFYGGRILWVIPLTTSEKSGDYYFKMPYVDFRGKSVAQRAMIPHLRAISHKRLIRKLRVLSKHEFLQLTEQVKTFLNA